MIIVPIKEGENIERALKKFKRKFEKTGIVRELRNRKTFVKKSVARRDELKKAISDSIRSKGDDLVGNMASQGTTPRQLTDLIGSLCDLTSGSGDKGTPVVLVQGYFDNYTN